MAENIENIPLYQIKANIETRKKIAEIQKLNERRQELLALPERYNIQKQKIEDDLSKIKNPKSHNYLVISQQLRMINLEIDNLGSLMSEIPKIEKRIDDLHNYIQGLPYIELILFDWLKWDTLMIVIFTEIFMIQAFKGAESLWID